MIMRLIVIFFMSLFMCNAQAPTIRNYSASAPQVNSVGSDEVLLIRNGKYVTFSWRTRNADYVDINGDLYPSNGTATYLPVAEYTPYVLTAHSNSTSATDTASIYVEVCNSTNCDGGPLLPPGGGGHGKDKDKDKDKDHDHEHEH